MQIMDKAISPNQLYHLLGTGEGKRALRSAPLSIGQSPYWYAAARIRKAGNDLSEVILFLQGPGENPRRLTRVEAALLKGELTDADGVLDAVKDMVECVDDSDGSAAAKSFLAGWVCADVIGRCLTESEAD
ncbi:MAG: hypothetical protein KAH21_02135 [Spirochaetaceae bacterium]|nr:hypothetical protein [Spirochaetaceae bacterium]